MSMPPPTVPASPLAFPNERRQQLTVMFCDLVGSTLLAQRLDPEELRDLMQTFISVCHARVKEFDGHLAQVLGDGLLIYFGWPVAHEDDAERCVRAALEIVEAVKRIRDHDPLSVRIGIATGPVVVGGAGGGGTLALAVGEPPNLAFRLQSAADPNTVVIARSTRALVGDVFELTDLSTLTLAGIGPSPAWRVEAVRRIGARFDAAHAGRPLSALVGRTEEVACLLREWQVARAGSGRAVLVGGEAGIGKSRLTKELRERIAGESHTTLRYQCSPFHRDVPFYPVIGFIEFAARFARHDTPDQKLDKLEALLVGSAAEREESAHLLASLLSLPTDRYPSLGLSPRQQRERTLAALLGQIERFSRARPVLVVIEDAHWIDPTSQALVDTLISRLPLLPVLLVITHRTEPPYGYEPHWIEAAHVRPVRLRGLTQWQAAALARNVAGGKALPPTVLDQIVGRTDGQPLYVEELTKSVLESPHLREEADRYSLVDRLPTLAIPPTLEALLIERMGRREGMSRLAQIGAFIGRVFSHELLTAVAAGTIPDLDQELEELIRTDLVIRRGNPPHAVYTFKHALVQDAAYKSVPIQKRPRLHAHIAALLERDFEEIARTQPELLARHRTAAGQLLQAIPLWRAAGESALARFALQEAVNYLESGLDLIPRLPIPNDATDDVRTEEHGRRTLELSLRRPLHTARLRWRSWSNADVGANARALLALAEEEQDAGSLLIGLWGIWINTITQGRVAESRPWADRLLAEGIRRGDVDLQVFGHRALQSSHFYVGELQEALADRDRILRLYDPRLAPRWMELTGNDTKTAVGVFASQALWMLGFPDQAAELSDQKDADSRTLGNPFDIGWALTWGAYVFDYRCEPERMLAGAAEADRLGREQSIPLLYGVLVPMIEGLAFLRQGLLPEAVSALRAGIDGWQSRDGQLNVPYLKCALAEALARGGDLDGALRILDQVLEQLARPGWHERVWLPEALRLKGWVLMRQGRRIEAESQLDASITCAQRQHARSWELRSATTLAELLIDVGEREQARERLQPVYAAFTEGFETHDLIAARAVLDAIGR